MPVLSQDVVLEMLAELRDALHSEWAIPIVPGKTTVQDVEKAWNTHNDKVLDAAYSVVIAAERANILPAEQK